MNTHAQHADRATHLLPTFDLTIIPKRRVRAKQPRIGAAILHHDALCLLFARRPRLLERIARAKELFPAIRVPSLESRLVDANHVAWVGDAGGTGPGGGRGGRAMSAIVIVIGLRRRLRLLRVRIEFGEVAGRSIGRQRLRLCVLWQVAGAGIWVAARGWDGVLLWEPAGWLESTDAGGLGAHLPVGR